MHRKELWFIACFWLLLGTLRLFAQLPLPSSEVPITLQLSASPQRKPNLGQLSQAVQRRPASKVAHPKSATA